MIISRERNIECYQLTLLSWAFKNTLCFLGIYVYTVGNGASFCWWIACSLPTHTERNKTQQFRLCRFHVYAEYEVCSSRIWRLENTVAQSQPLFSPFSSSIDGLMKDYILLYAYNLFNSLLTGNICLNIILSQSFK